MTDRTWQGASTGTGVLNTPAAPLPTPAITAAVTSYRKAALRVAALGELADLAEAGIELSDMHADDLAHACQRMAGAHATLAAAGRLDLIGGA
jgi:hypothetical protein